MKVAILTTETPHHAHFVRELGKIGATIEVYCETAGGAAPPFNTHHPFEDDRERHEWQLWFGGTQVAIDELAPTRRFATLNSPEAVTALRQARADVAVVFGTGLLKASVIDACGNMMLNLHGGDPEHYRGLDTHLWAIFHRDFAGLVTTLHRLDAGLDTGDIVLQGEIPLAQAMPLHALRSANTELCVHLSVMAINTIARDGDVPSRRQRQVGRYYSAMPAELKSLCKVRFDRYIEKVAR